MKKSTKITGLIFFIVFIIIMIGSVFGITQIDLYLGSNQWLIDAALTYSSSEDLVYKADNYEYWYVHYLTTDGDDKYYFIESSDPTFEITSVVDDMIYYSAYGNVSGYYISSSGYATSSSGGTSKQMTSWASNVSYGEVISGVSLMQPTMYVYEDPLGNAYIFKGEDLDDVVSISYNINLDSQLLSKFAWDKSNFIWSSSMPGWLGTAPYVVDVAFKMTDDSIIEQTLNLGEKVWTRTETYPTFLYYSEDQYLSLKVSEPLEDDYMVTITPLDYWFNDVLDVIEYLIPIREDVTEQVVYLDAIFWTDIYVGVDKFYQVDIFSEDGSIFYTRFQIRSEGGDGIVRDVIGNEPIIDITENLPTYDYTYDSDTDTYIIDDNDDNEIIVVDPTPINPTTGSGNSIELDLQPLKADMEVLKESTIGVLYLFAWVYGFLPSPFPELLSLATWIVIAATFVFFIRG